MKQTITFVLLLALTAGCKKETDEKNNDSAYEQLVSATWYGETENGVALSACEKLSRVKFSTDGILATHIYLEGDGDCGNPNLNIRGTYEVDGNTLRINLSIGSSSGTYSISNGILTTTLTSEDLTTINTYDKEPG